MLLLPASHVCTHIIVRQSSSRENRNFLATSNTVHGIYGRDTSLYHFFRIYTRPRIDGLSLNIKEIFSKNIWAFIFRFAWTIENSSYKNKTSNHRNSWLLVSTTPWWLIQVGHGANIVPASDTKSWRQHVKNKTALGHTSSITKWPLFRQLQHKVYQVRLYKRCT